MKYYGKCPASCGELIQGFIKDEEYLSSYAIDIYSTACIEEKINEIKNGPPKSRRAIEKVFEYYNIPVGESKNLSLEIKSQIPVGKGMASSTADIGATIIATTNFLNKNINMEEISTLAAQIEATDSKYMENINIFNPTKGKVIKYLGDLPKSKVIVLEPNSIIKTSKMREKYDYEEIKKRNTSIIEEAFCMLEDGIFNRNLKTIGQACNLSSLANENILQKPELNKIIEVSEDYGAYGVNVAHSGTVLGIIIDEFMDESKLINKLIEKNINSYYKKIYTTNIIKGGIRGYSNGIYKESNENRREKF